jgi:hypothetical protein
MGGGSMGALFSTWNHLLGPPSKNDRIQSVVLIIHISGRQKKTRNRVPRAKTKPRGEVYCSGKRNERDNKSSDLLPGDTLRTRRQLDLSTQTSAHHELAIIFSISRGLNHTRTQRSSGIEIKTDVGNDIMASMMHRTYPVIQHLIPFLTFSIARILRDPGRVACSMALSTSLYKGRACGMCVAEQNCGSCRQAVCF